MLEREFAARLGNALATEGTAAEAAARELLDQVRVGFLGTHDADGPYVVPVSFAYDGEVVHLHGGPGKKAAALAADPRACLTVCADPELMLAAGPCSDNFRYRSVLAYGHVREVTDSVGKEAGLRAIIAKYHPERVDAPLPRKTVAKTLVYRMEIRALTFRQHPDDPES